MIILVLLLALGIRLINLNQSLWLDEAISVVAAQSNSYIGLISTFSRGDFHPPFYYLILKLWGSVFGFSEISVRFPSVIFGVITIVFTYLITKKLYNKKIGLIAAILLAVNPLAVYYSQEARMYSLAAMAVSGAVYFFLQKKWLPYFFFLLSAVYSDYLSWFILPVFFLLSSDRRKYIKYYLLFIIFLLPSFFIIIPQALGSLTVPSSSWGDILGRTNVNNILLIPVKFIIGRISLENKILYGAVCFLLITFYSLIFSRVRNRLLWLWLLLPVLIGIIISLKVPILSYFRFLFVLPAFVILLAVGAKNIKTKILVFLISLISLIVFNISPKFWREDWRSAIKYLQTNPGIVIIPSIAQSAPLQYYRLSLPLEDSNMLAFYNARIIYLFRYVQEVSDPNDIARLTLENHHYKFVESKNFNGVLVWKYEKT